MKFFESLKDFSIQVLKNNKHFAIFITLFYAITRIPTWFLSYDSDHWWFYYVGRNFIQGGTLYVDAWDHKPPMIFLFNGILHLLFSDNLVPHRIFMTIVSIIAVYLFYKLTNFFLEKNNSREVQSLDNNSLSKLALIFFVFWTNLVQFNGSGNNTEDFALPFIIGMLLSYLYFSLNKKNLYLIISGICFGIIFYLKPNFTLFALPIFIDLLIENRKNIVNLLAKGIIFLVPFFVISGLWILYFVQRNALNDFYIASFTFSSKYVIAGWKGHISPQLPFLAMSGTLFAFVLPFIYRQLKFAKQQINQKYVLFLNIWLLSVLIFSAMLGTFYPYYYQVVIPCLAIVLVLNLNFLKKMPKLFMYIIFFVMFATSTVSIGIAYRQFYSATKGAAHIEEIQNNKVADYIKTHSNSSDKIFAYTYGSTFYILSQRESGSRYVSASVLLVDYREKFGYNLNDIFISDMNKSKAKFVIYPKGTQSFYLQNKPLVEFFQNNYKETGFETEDYKVLEIKN